MAPSSSFLPRGIACILVSETEINERVQKLAAEIITSLPEGAESVLVLSILSGSFVFTADLVRALHGVQSGGGGAYISIETDFMRCQSYEGDTRGEIRLGDMGKRGIDTMRGRHVLIVDDIIDSGKTMDAVIRSLSDAGCASVTCCCLLSKQARRVVTPSRCVVGFEIEDRFVVGYGLDFDEAWRQLPYIAVMSPQ